MVNIDMVAFLFLGLLLGGGATFILLRFSTQNAHQKIEHENQIALVQSSIRLEAYEAQCDHFRQQTVKIEQERDKVRDTLVQTQQQLAGLAAQLAGERQQNEEKLALLANAREALVNQFKTLANDILEEKTRRFTEQNQANLGILLHPLNERIQNFSKLVQDTYDKDSKERLTLEQELKHLQELNTRLHQDAVALTNALTGTQHKIQGTWGEMILEKVLETSGLQRNREYRVQVSSTQVNDEGSYKRYQPDVVIDLPDNKQLVIDSKVSLNAYLRYTAAQDPALRENALKAHVAAIRAHIKHLSEKRYQDLYKLATLDFVFMFIPVEPAYLLAVQQDMELFNEAFEQRIVVVGPSTLLATLRTVASIWRYEYQNQNAQEIARQGGAMVDKLIGFSETMEKLGKYLEQSLDMYRVASNKLSAGNGNLIGRAQKLRELGVQSNKNIPPHLLSGER